MITDGYGYIVERRSFDVWGRMRSVQWRDSHHKQSVLQDAMTNRGYTGHEHIEEVALIHMNGRVYDQELGRFLSADPLIQSPYVTGSFNRYTYTWNNPLKYIDPTGFRHVEGAGLSDDGLGRSVHNSSSGKVTHFDRNGRNTGSESKRYGDDNLPSQRQSFYEASIPTTRWGQLVTSGISFVRDQYLDLLAAGANAYDIARRQGWLAGAQLGLQGYINQKLKNFKVFKQIEDALEAPKEWLSSGPLPKSPRGNGSYEAEGDFGALNQSSKVAKSADISTGRTEAKDLKEQLAMEEVKSNPSGVTPPRMPDTKNNLLHKDGWVKRTQNVNGVEVHYVENINTKEVIDFKFKDC
ncbi:RHS repeat-associated core domain-containing protein [Photobacterium sp. GJ3]|uniref:RHS repeat domain-containing protein n=1 Tax=Photobacterium sp. GJ3 TaxID=2829502 RepID=UPI001B8C3717|nr:RHS repeat-associated core domain-containing protein [Photobacterium sp. GJ3]QUJ67400.1 RHS repeat-associated core domain-containing protein [Photobacterium sp. GJ3]